MTGVPVASVHDGLVSAWDPPRHSVRVQTEHVVIGDGPRPRFSTFEVWIGATTSLGRSDILVRRDSRLLVILGPEGYKPSPSWHLVEPDDALLAVVTLPPHTSTVLGSFIQDCRVIPSANGGRS